MFRLITYELRLVRDLVHGIKSLALHIGSIMEPKLAAIKEELRELPANWFSTLQEALIGLVEKDCDGLTAAEKVLKKQRRRETPLRGRRDGAKSELYDLLLKARQFLEGSMGAGAAVDLTGLDPNLANVEPLVLLRYGSAAIDDLLEPGFEPSVLVIGGEVITPEKYAERIVEAHVKLEKLDNRAARQERVSEQALKVKTEELEKVHARTLSVARIFEDLYSLAGEEFHAERLRSATRRRRAAPATGEDDVSDSDAVPDQDLDNGDLEMKPEEEPEEEKPEEEWPEEEWPEEEKPEG